MARVMLHGAYRELAGGLREISVGGGSVRSVLAHVVRTCPQLAERLRDEHGRLREHLRLFVNGNDVEDLQGEDTLIGEADTVQLSPALSGGT